MVKKSKDFSLYFPPPHYIALSDVFWVFFVCFCFYFFLAKLQFSYLNITHGLCGIHLTSRMGDKISEVNCVH